MSGESQILEKAITGSLPAFEELISLYEKKVYNYCYRMTNSREDAEDLTQEVFIKVYRNLKSFKGNSQFSTWLYRIAHNICIDKYRKTKTDVIPLTYPRDKEDDWELDIPSSTPSPEDSVLSMEQQEIIKGCINKLKPDYRSVIVLRDLQHHSYEEIAEIMKVPLGTVKSNISRARVALRKTLDAFL